MDKKGLTLIELLIVIAIISILAMIAVPAYIGQQKSAARTEAYSNLQNLRLLEEQFFAENARYTATLGAAGSTFAVRDANETAIRTTANEALPGFQPGNAANFSYRIVTNQDMNAAAQTPCFHAIATGITGTRVAGETFDIDCNNNRNF